MATHSSTLSDTDTIWNVEFENRRFANSGLLLLNESLCIIKSNALACDLHNMKTLINSYFLDCIVKPLRSQFLKEITSLQTVLGEGSSQKLQFRVLSSRDGLSISGGTQVNILMKIHKVLINQASFYFIYEIQSSPGRALTASPHFSPEISECTQVESIGLFMEGLRHSPHMALIVSKYDCLMANQAFYKTLGYKEDDVFNMNLFDFLDLSNKALFKKYYDHVVCLRKSENILPYRLHLTTKFGRKIPCLVHFKQIATRESESAVVFYFTNLSAQLLSERKFKQEKKEREGLLLEKGRHLQTINHEVRNCMNFVPSSLEVMVARINALQGQGIVPNAYVDSFY